MPPASPPASTPAVGVGRAGAIAGRLLALTANRWVRIGFAVVAVGLAALWLARHAAEVGDAAANLAWPYLIAGLGLGFASIAGALLSWRALLADLGSPLPLRAAMRVFLLGQLGKYLPGSVWSVVAQVELAREHRVPRSRSGAAALLAMAVTVVAGLVVAGLTLPFAERDAVQQYWWTAPVLVVLLVSLHPRVLSRLVGVGLKVLRRDPLEREPTFGGLGRALGWAFAGWACSGTQVYLLALAVGGDPVRSLPLAIGGYALAWCVGFLIVVLPAGAVAREAALLVLLAPVLSRADAAVVVLASRVLMTIGDLGWAGIAALAGRDRCGQRLRAGVSDTPEPTTGDTPGPRAGDTPDPSAGDSASIS